MVMVGLLLVVFASEGETLFDFVSQNLESAFILQGNPLNGYLFGYLVLKSLWVHFPILIALVTGDLISGERQSGTFRLILTRPVNRTSIVLSKFIAAITYVVALVSFMAVVSLLVGVVLFGTGDLLVIVGRLNVFAEGDTLWRFVMSYAFGILSMATVASLAVCLSGLVRNSVAAILGTIAIIIVLNFMATFEVPFFDLLKPYLFTTYMNSWQLFFSYDLSTSQVLTHAGVLIFHIVAFIAITTVIFNKRDITS